MLTTPDVFLVSEMDYRRSRAESAMRGVPVRRRRRGRVRRRAVRVRAASLSAVRLGAARARVAPPVGPETTRSLRGSESAAVDDATSATRDRDLVGG